MNRKRSIWRFCCVAVLVMAVLTFTPLVTPAGKSAPYLMGVPFTMWMGFLWTVIILILTFIGTRVHPGFNSDNQE